MKSTFKITVIPALLFLALVAFDKGDQSSTTDHFVTEEGPWVAPPEADKITNPLEIDEYTLEDGMDVYTTNCISCHGEKGDGDTPVSAAFDPKPKNFTEPGFLDQSDGAIFWKISTGRGLMASYKDILSEEEIWSAIVYIKSLAEAGK